LKAPYVPGHACAVTHRDFQCARVIYLFEGGMMMVMEVMIVFWLLS
jgi:hypothetical protein